MSNGNPDYWARSIAILSLVVTIVTFAYDHFRGPHMRAGSGKYVYIQGRPRIGVPVGFFNQGGRAAIVNAGVMKLDDGSNTFLFDLTLLSSAEKWTDNSSGRTEIPAAFSLFSQVVVKPGDTSDGVFWYSPELTEFKFLPDRKYTATLDFLQHVPTESQSNELCSAGVIFRVDSKTVNNALANPEVPYPIIAE